MTDEQEEREDQIDGAYGSQLIINDLGTIFVITEMWCFYFISIFIVRLLCCSLCRVKKVNIFYQQFKNSTFWGAFLRTGLELYIEMAISLQLTLRTHDLVPKGVEKHSNHVIMAKYLSLLALIVVIFLPIFFLYILRTKKKEIKRE